MKTYIAITAIVAGLISGFTVLEYQQYRTRTDAQTISQQTAQAMIGAPPQIHDPTDVPFDTSKLPGTR